MRLCIIGKYPPIEGGVSTHTYWCAHSLAALGHEVHVVTNAREVEAPFSMLMRPEDWSRCEATYPQGGAVRVHWTEPYDPKQWHIPAHNPFATKLAALAAQIVQEYDLELIFSYYLEPYGIAGHLAASMCGRPHVVKHAGSDIGRLYTHAQLGPVYKHVLRSADRVVTGQGTAQQLTEAGLDETQLFLGDDFRIPEAVFSPSGVVLDLPQVFADGMHDTRLTSLFRGSPTPRQPILGIYGKLGEAKGTFHLLRALQVLKRRGQAVSLLVVGHGWKDREARFHQTIAELGLGDCVTQLPFLPHWRIPELIRLCQAVCFLECDFPLTFHAPTIPREVQACGGCLVASAAILREQYRSERLVHGYNCFAVRTVGDADALATTLGLALHDPERARGWSARVRVFRGGRVDTCLPPELGGFVQRRHRRAAAPAARRGPRRSAR